VHIGCLMKWLNGIFCNFLFFLLEFMSLKIKG
jgi:hypothetical protein